MRVRGSGSRGLKGLGLLGKGAKVGFVGESERVWLVRVWETCL